MPEFKYNLNDVHRHLLQYIISRGYVERSLLEQKFREFFSVHRNSALESNPPNSVSLEDYIEEISDNLSTLHMIISYHIFKPDGKWYYSISNLTSDNVISKLATNYTALEIQFFKSIIYRIVELENNNKKLFFFDALDARPKEMKLEDADNCLERFIREGWIYEETQNTRFQNSEGRILWFGIRTCHDLRAYLDQELQYLLP